MLYCNDELVKLKDDEWKHLKPEFDEIRKMKSPIKIKTTQRFEYNATGLPEMIPAHAWPLQATVINKDGQSETWIYTDNTPKWEGDKLVFSRRSIMIQHGLISVDPIKETDKAYYLLKLSGLINSGLYEVEDLDKKNTEEVAKIGDNVAVEYFVCNKYSPIYNNHRRIRQLAASWGVINSEHQHIDTIRKMLVDKVHASQKNYEVTKRGVNEFVNEVNGEDAFSEYRSIIQLAKDKKIIGWNEKDKGWYFMDSSSGSFVDPITFISATQLSQKDIILFDFIRMNAQLFEVIRKAVYGDRNDSYAHLDWHALRKLAKERNIEVLKRSAEEIIDDLIKQDKEKESVQ